ncbi:fungal-specific transcription factor domain-containing protein [Trichoderma sp. SZMC 28014]
MNTSASGSEPQRAGEIGKRALKANKACVPCRVRKAKCDAAVVGLPCGSCTSRQCAKECVLPVRKARTRKSKRSKQSKQPSTSDPLDCQSPHETGPDLLYFNILNNAVKEHKTAASSRHYTSSSTTYPRSEDSLTPWNCLWTKLPKLDDIDHEYLIKKGVLELPPSRYLDALVKTYFEYVHPFAPVIDRADFIRDYQSGDCSLFLLRVIITTASLYVPIDVLSACGFASRSAAQESFFSKAKLLHDFAAEDNPMLILQGSIILCRVILDHPTDRDCDYWFHNAILFATRLNIRNIISGRCVREEKPRKALRLYRRIWWTLYFLDIFHVFSNPRRSRLLEDHPAIKPRTEDDWEEEDISGASSSLLSAVTPQQKALPVVYCELSRIFGQCFSNITNRQQQDLRQIMQSIDTWRESLAAKMHIGGNTSRTNIYYLDVQAMSYRFECVLCRMIGHIWQPQSRHADWSEWAKQRLQSAVLELDTIITRVLASGTIQEFPTSFVTTITALLALHIESALNPVETDLLRSRARISIIQTMLVLTQGKEIPALKRALPVFEEILAKKNLYLIPPNMLGQVSAQVQSQDDSITDAWASSNAQVGSVVSSQLEQCENNSSFDLDFLGFDFLDEWRTGQVGFAGRD